MKSKLGIDFDKVGHAREMARKIADQVQDFVDGYTTVAVERTLCRLLGIDGVDVHAVPLPNILVDELKEKNVLGEGILFFLGNVMVETGMTPQEIAEQVAAGKVDVTRVPVCTPGQREKALQPYIEASIRRISDNRKRRENYIATIGEGAKPYLYVIVATGNIYEDVVQAQAAARQGADVIAVIRTTGQSLLDYVPYGATTEGFGGTFATQENFRIMRKALDEVGEEVGRYIRLCNYCSGLCMPEIAVMGALEGLDVMLNDALYGILFRDINMQRTLVDQFMSRVINGFAGVIINTGEDNYLTTADAVEEAHTVLASDLINEQLARYLSIENARYIFNNMKNIGDEVVFKENGIIQNRAKEVLDKATVLLEKIEREGLFTALEKAIFADIKRPKNGGKGLDGVCAKGKNYSNPFVEIMMNR